MANDLPPLEIKLDPENANLGTDRGQAMVELSIELYGAGRSVVVDKSGTLVAGNKTYAAASKAGLPIREIHTQGDELVVVVRDDLDLLVDDSAREMAFIDNRAAQVGINFSPDRLVASIDSGLDLSKFFTANEVKHVREESARLAQEATRAPLTPQEAQAKRFEELAPPALRFRKWRIDCTEQEIEDFDRLMAEWVEEAGTSVGFFLNLFARIEENEAASGQEN